MDGIKFTNDQSTADYQEFKNKYPETKPMAMERAQLIHKRFMDEAKTHVGNTAVLCLSH